MTTTHIYQGMDADTKNSSRVLRPPGGASSFSLGFDDPSDQSQKPAQRTQHQQSSDGLVYGSPPAKPHQQQAATADARAEKDANMKQHDTHSAIFGGNAGSSVQRTGKAQGPNNPADAPYATSSNGNNTEATSNNQSRGAYNPITGQEYQPNQNVRSSTKQHQPPGGASSGLW